MQIYKLSHKQKVLAVFIVVTVACISILTVQFTHSSKSSHLLPAKSTLLAPAVNANPVAETQLAIASASPVTSVASHHVIEPQTTLRSWHMGNIKTASPSIPLSEKISDYTIVQVEHPAPFPVVGDQIELPMLNGQYLIANVESTTANPNGDYTWSGHLQGHGTDYPVVMTYGEHAVFATITTPEGSYTMESLDGIGWLYKNPAEVELSTSGAKDFLDVREAQ